MSNRLPHQGQYSKISTIQDRDGNEVDARPRKSRLLVRLEALDTKEMSDMIDRNNQIRPDTVTGSANRGKANGDE